MSFPIEFAISESIPLLTLRSHLILFLSAIIDTVFSIVLIYASFSPWYSSNFQVVDRHLF